MPSSSDLAEWTAVDYLISVEAAVSELLDWREEWDAAISDEDRQRLRDEWTVLSNRARALIATGPPE